MTDHVIDRATPRLGPIDRYSPAVLLTFALLFGVVAQSLFYRNPIGINVGVAAIVILFVAHRLRPSGARIDSLDRWIVPAAVIFAFLPALRVDPMLLLFDVPAAFVLLVMAVVSFAGVPLTRRAADILVVLGLVVVGRIVAGGALLLAALPDLGRPLARRTGGRIVSVGIGIALAFPFLLVFAFLFASADAVFSNAVSNVFDLRNWSIGELIGRVLLTGLFAWVGGGLFLLAGRGAETTMSPLLPRLRGLLSSTAGATTLLAVDALFLFFVALQVAYLFGGIDTLNATGLSYSAYARRGFFELIAVAALAGGLLFAVELVVAGRTRFYVGAALMLALATLVIVVSAAYRMQLYQLAYGWTEQRFYALAGIVWLGASGACAAALVSRDAMRWLPHAAALIGLVVVGRIVAGGALLLAALPDLGRPLSLGDGAVPTLVEFLPRLGASDRAALGSALRGVALEGRGLDPVPLPGFSVDRERARGALLGVAEELRSYPLPRGAPPRPRP